MFTAVMSRITISWATRSTKSSPRSCCPSHRGHGEGHGSCLLLRCVTCCCGTLRPVLSKSDSRVSGVLKQTLVSDVNPQMHMPNKVQCFSQSWHTQAEPPTLPSHDAPGGQYAALCEAQALSPRTQKVRSSCVAASLASRHTAQTKVGLVVFGSMPSGSNPRPPPLVVFARWEPKSQITGSALPRARAGLTYSRCIGRLRSKHCPMGACTWCRVALMLFRRLLFSPVAAPSRLAG